MTKTNSISIIDDFYNDDIIVNYEKETTKREKVDFYSTKKSIRPSNHVTEKIGFRFKKAFTSKKINYTEDIEIENNREFESKNNFIPKKNSSETISVPLHRLSPNQGETPAMDRANLSRYPNPKIGLYKNLLENASINDIIKNDPVDKAVLSTNTNYIKQEEPRKSLGLFASIKNLFSLKKS